jgi:hypothetical protein
LPFRPRFSSTLPNGVSRRSAGLGVRGRRMPYHCAPRRSHDGALRRVRESVRAGGRFARPIGSPPERPSSPSRAPRWCCSPRFSRRAEGGGRGTGILRDGPFKRAPFRARSESASQSLPAKNNSQALTQVASCVPFSAMAKRNGERPTRGAWQTRERPFATEPTRRGGGGADVKFAHHSERQVDCDGVFTMAFDATDRVDLPRGLRALRRHLRNQEGRARKSALRMCPLRRLEGVCREHSSAWDHMAYAGDVGSLGALDADSGPRVGRRFPARLLPEEGNAHDRHVRLLVFRPRRRRRKPVDNARDTALNRRPVRGQAVRVSGGHGVRRDAA